jgi:valyl-tRNA synthetase
MHEGEIPWRHVVLSGWILDPDRKKMSKSKGNVVTPDDLLVEWSSDAVRYWAARARLGTDTAFDPGVFKVGKRLAMKVFNASRFVIMQVDAAGGEVPGPEHIADPLDLALIERLRSVTGQATRYFEAFDYASALQVIEESFWQFCDHYLELVKLRSYSDEDTPGRRSALAALGLGLNTYLRLLAPFQPFVTEEVWSWSFAGEGRARSVHTSAWPTAGEFEAVPRPAVEGTFEAAVEVMTAIRGAKTVAQKSLRWPVASLEIAGPEAARDSLAPVIDDILRAGNVADGALALSDGEPSEGERFAITVVLGEEQA